MASIRVKYNRIDKVPQQLENAIEKALDETGERAVRIARSLVRVRTGALQGSIGYELSKAAMRFYAGKHYATYNEFGTSRMAAKPFMRPAVEAVRGQFAGIMAAHGRSIGS